MSAKVFDVFIKEIHKIVALFLCELQDSTTHEFPIFFVSDNCNKLIHDVAMSYDIWNQELELYNFSFLFLLVLDHDGGIDFFLFLYHITIL